MERNNESSCCTRKLKHTKFLSADLRLFTAKFYEMENVRFLFEARPSAELEAPEPKACIKLKQIRRQLNKKLRVIST